jgi:hypothetical protein
MPFVAALMALAAIDRWRRGPGYAIFGLWCDEASTTMGIGVLEFRQITALEDGLRVSGTVRKEVDGGSGILRLGRHVSRGFDPHGLTSTPVSGCPRIAVSGRPSCWPFPASVPLAHETVSRIPWTGHE